MQLRELELKKRTLTALHKAQIFSIEDVQKHLKTAKLTALSGIGRNSARDIETALENAGVTLPEPPTQERLPTPDDDQLADIVIANVRSEYRYFYGGWYKWEEGLWQSVKNIYNHVIKTLRENRKLGVRPSRARVTSVEFFCQNALEIPDDTVVDDYPNLFNVENGLFNLDTMELQPHQKDVYVTAQAGFAYDATAGATTFKSWLAEMLVKPDAKATDWDLVNLVQEMMGYCLTGDTSHRLSFWLVGASGTGKSTLVNLMVKMAKSYHTTIDLNQLATNRFLLARVAGKRLVTSVEASAGTRLEDGMYKTLVSDDVILADVKNRDPIEFIPQCKVVWAMNNLPYVSDRSGAVDSRVKIIPMLRSIPRQQWDLRLDEKLQAELPGIFNFALEGLQRLRKQGAFSRVEQSEVMGDEYRKMQDIYAAFLEDEQWCQLDDGKTEPTLLYKAFSAWCDENGIRNFASKISIAREWERLGLQRVHSGKRYYAGVTLLPQVTKRFNF